MTNIFWINLLRGWALHHEHETKIFFWAHHSSLLIGSKTHLGTSDWLSQVCKIYIPEISHNISAAEALLTFYQEWGGDNKGEDDDNSDDAGPGLIVSCHYYTWQ